jgi:thymidylate synthase (FAD)
VSNPANQDSTDTKLLGYLMKHGHVSPFEMANACIEIETTRDIGRQLLRHRSMSFQEFSQRYADVSLLADSLVERECRLQDTKNRQNSIDCNDGPLSLRWSLMQQRVHDLAMRSYEEAIVRGIAKEQARALLPEGLTMSRMYANATLRSWIHYLQSRLDPSTQKEHRELAQAILVQLRTVAPITMGAFFPEAA